MTNAPQTYIGMGALILGETLQWRADFREQRHAERRLGQRGTGL